MKFNIPKKMTVGGVDYVVNIKDVLNYNEDTGVAVRIIHGNCFRCAISGIKIKYVHEFQHLMRLRGLL